MSKKIYQVLVSWNSSADVFIEAENEEQAKENAVKLVEEGRGEFSSQDAGHFQADDVRKVNKPEASEKKEAQENKNALAELEAEE
jgi:hypothetical protein